MRIQMRIEKETISMDQGQQISYGKNVTTGLHVVIEPDVTIGDDVTIGNHVVIKSGTQIGSGVQIGDLSVLGKGPASNKKMALKPAADLPPLLIGDDVKIGCGVVIYAG